MKVTNSKRNTAVMKRREFLTSAPLAGAALCVPLAPSSAESGNLNTNKYEPVYRETRLVEDYYRFARF